MKALLIDHDDSFTQNLKHWLLKLFKDVSVVKHTDINQLKKINNTFDLIVFSPGPKHPKDYSDSFHFLNSLSANQAVFGVCLGLQLMAYSQNEKVLAYSPPKHGKTSRLKVLDSQLSEFSQLKVARYHSLKVELQTQNHFKVLAESQDDHHPMWLQHQFKKWMGVQFHPESFLTEQPELHLKFLYDWLS